ncbi:MAG: acetolactate synthase large subunit [Proteobacteria bacterium]|nr:acetolactate synthase large subunit [Pseudomonadota bacterium]
MKAAQRLLEYAAGSGVSACFANPGTSEMHLVAALDSAPAIRAILCLFEGVATGAADGFGRMARQPALTLLHLGPGLANGIANLHNAYRARTPILSLIGEHATYHRANNPPLASDIAALARPVSAWLKTAETPADLIVLAAEGLEAARRNGPAALILPADVAWSDAEPRAAGPPPTAAPGDQWEQSVDAVAKTLGPDAALLLGGRILTPRASAAAQRIAEKTGAKVLVETFPARIARGGDSAPLKRLPYLTEMAVGLLADVKSLVLAGAADPVAFFALPGRATRLSPENVRTIEYVRAGSNPEAALEALAEAVGAKDDCGRADSPAALPNTDTAIDPYGFAQVIAATLPEHAIVSDESNTLGLYAFDAAAGAPAHDWLTLTGGAIGQGLPLATGAAVACPDRRVLALEADGSALYTIQSLWTQAREGLNVTNVILNNGAYAILRLEMMRVGITEQTQTAANLFDLRRPSIDFTALAAGFGVPATRVSTLHELAQALRRSFATPGPALIEVVFA